MIVIDHSWYERSPDVPVRVSAGGVVVRRDRTTDQLLIAVVEEGDRPINTGYILPKGHVEPGESIEAAARREIHEEAGLSQLHLIQKLDVCERLNLHKTAWKVVHYFLFTTTQTLGQPTDTQRAYQLHWFPLDSLPPMIWPEQRRLLEQCQALGQTDAHLW
jgi:ADP-ribose pyrophosphatase YjhB (NUDIX family)